MNLWEDNDTSLSETKGLDQLSNNVVDVMKAIARNKGIRHLLSLDSDDPFNPGEEDVIPSASDIVSPSFTGRKILPVSFDTKATTDAKTEIRVYYNVGRIDGSGKKIDANMHIDIICAKSLWQIQDKNGSRSLIRPYEIMSRIADEIGADNRNGINLGRISQFQMLSVNEQFDSIRMYYNIYDISGNMNTLKGV